MSEQDRSRQVGMPDAEAGSASSAIFKAVLGGAVAAFVASWLYGPAEYYSPVVYLNLAMTYGMGWLIGKCAQVMVMKRRINSVGPAILVGVASGAFGVWFSWLTYVWAISGFNFLAYLHVLNPVTLFRYMHYLANVPRWSFGSNIDPTFYYGLWALELLVVAGLSAHRCYLFVRENRLCDACRDWVKFTGDIAAFAVPSDSGHSLKMIAAGDMAALARLERRSFSGDGARNWLVARGYACAECLDKDSMVSVSLVSLRRNKKTKEYEQVERILARYVPVAVDLEKRIFEPDASEIAYADALDREAEQDGDDEI